MFPGGWGDLTRPGLTYDVYLFSVNFTKLLSWRSLSNTSTPCQPTSGQGWRRVWALLFELVCVDSCIQYWEYMVEREGLMFNPLQHPRSTVAAWSRFHPVLDLKFLSPFLSILINWKWLASEPTRCASTTKERRTTCHFVSGCAGYGWCQAGSCGIV